MNRSQVAIALKAAVAAEIARLNTLNAAELAGLGSAGVLIIVVVDNIEYKIVAQSETVAHGGKGVCVVLVGVQQPMRVGYVHHLDGFFVAEDHAYSDISASEIWRYD